MLQTFDKPAYLSFDASTKRLALDPHEPAFVQDPYAAYAFLHGQEKPFFWGEFGHWCFGGFEEVNRLLRDRRLGRERPGGYMRHVTAAGERSHLAAFDALEAASLLELEAPAHTRLRGLVNRAFVSRQIERLRPKIEELAARLVDGLEKAGGGELITDFATPLPATIIAEMMGMPAEDAPQLVAWSNDMVRMYMHAPSAEVARQANASSEAFSRYVRHHAAARRRAPSDDLLSVLVSANAEGERLTEDELVSSAVLILNAGHEATVHQTGNAVNALLAQGGDVRRYFASTEATAVTVEECLRHDAPLHMFTRYAYEDIEPSPGVHIAAGEQIGLLLGCANRDPRAFSEPDRFDPGRADQKNVTFGAGIHFCIGAPLARLELQVSLKTLFDRLPGLRLAGEPVFRDTYHFHGLERLDVVVGG